MAQLSTPDRVLSVTPTIPILCIAVIYLSVLFVFPSEGFWINDNGLKFIQVQAWERSGYSDASILWPGQIFDPEFDYAPLQSPFGQVVDGKLFALYSPLFALLSSLAYRLVGQPGLYFLPLLGALLTLAAVQRLGERLCSDSDAKRNSGVVAASVAAFASPIWFYSYTFWEHTLALAACSWSFLAYLDYCQRPVLRRAAACVGLASTAAYFRTDAYLFAVIMLGLCVLQERRAWRTAIILIGVAALCLSPLWIFHTWATGHPLGLHLQASGWGDLGLAEWSSSRGQVLRSLLVNTHGSPGLSFVIALPFLGLALYSVTLGARRMPSWLPIAALSGAVLGGGFALYGHFAAPRPLHWLLTANGLFAASPILILAFLRPLSSTSGYEASAAAAARRRALWVLLAYSGAYCAVVPQINSVGIHWGCRFLLVAYPILAALCAPILVAMWRGEPARTFTRSLAVAALVLSLVAQLYSLTLLRERKAQTARLAAEIASISGDFIITSLWYLPQDLARIFYERPIFLVRSEADTQAVLRMTETGKERTVVFIDPLRSPSERLPEARIFRDGWLRFNLLSVRAQTFQASPNTTDP